MTHLKNLLWNDSKKCLQMMDLSFFMVWSHLNDRPPASSSLTPLCLPHSSPSLISPSSVLNYPTVLLFSRGGLCWRSAEELSCAVCFFFFFFSSLHSFPQPRSKENKGGRSRRKGREGSYHPTGSSDKGELTEARVMERRTGHIKLPTRKKIRQNGQMDKGADRRKTDILRIHQRCLA